MVASYTVLPLSNLQCWIHNRWRFLKRETLYKECCAGNLLKTLSFERDSLKHCCEMVDMPLGSGLAALLISLFTFILIAWRSSTKSTPYPLPPGPKGEPIIGHMRIVPQENPQLYYQRLSEEYGEFLPLVYRWE